MNSDGFSRIEISQTSEPSRYFEKGQRIRRAELNAYMKIFQLIFNLRLAAFIIRLIKVPVM